MAGTGLSSHELNQPGTYRDVKDTTVVAQFRATEDSKAQLLAKCGLQDKGLNVDFLAWTTTPWTLPSNTAVAVHPEVTYLVARRGEDTLVVAEPLLGAVFGETDDVEVLARTTGRDWERVVHAVE